MLWPICAALALVLATPASARQPRAAAHAAQPPRRTAGAGNELDRARALLAQVKRDPAKRRYRHHWERAIAALEKAARGRNAAAALLEAARARYALYRFSQVDSDRDAALRLAVRAKRAGARDAAAFAAAVRREMGDDEEPAPAARKSVSPKLVPRPAARPDPTDLAGKESEASAQTPSQPQGQTQAQAPTKAQDERRSESAEAEAANAPRNEESRGEQAKDEKTDSEKSDDVAGKVDADDDEPKADPVLDQALSAAGQEEAAPEAEPARISDVRSWSNSDYTRVAVYLSRAIGFTKEEIPASGELPRRLALDLRPAQMGHELAHRVGDALVQRVRAAQHDPETVRVVLDLAGSQDLTIFSLDDPPRLIVDVGVREARQEARATTQQRAEAELGERRPIRRIIVDAGHGGHDSGAVGPTRVREKDVTLAMAKRLARRLQEKGFEVVLTRPDDRYVALEERTAIANARHGDLFLSIHANAHPHRDRSGVETYVLNVADDRYAARLAARENGALSDKATGVDEAMGDDVRRILTDLNAQSSSEASRRLAQVVQREMCAGIRGRVGEVRDLGVKSALFYVLLGARMPAVLLETSFISNRSEEKRLKSSRFQEEIASSVARAVVEFAAREARVASAR
jgi:N-acetylmuramoyl-L-alanine amidase